MMYQVSTLQALALGYSRAVINVAELMKMEMSARLTKQLAFRFQVFQ